MMYKSYVKILQYLYNKYLINVLLIKFYFVDKADKKAQRERELKMEREQIEREEEIKELSLKMRRKYVYV